MKKVFYYNEKLNTVITREDILHHVKTGNVALNWRQRVSPYPVFPVEELIEVEVETYTYNLLEIPIHEDWEVIVIDDESLSEAEISDVIHHMSRGHYSCKSPIIEKLTKTLNKLQEFRYKGIKFY